MGNDRVAPFLVCQVKMLTKTTLYYYNCFIKDRKKDVCIPLSTSTVSICIPYQEDRRTYEFLRYMREMARKPQIIKAL